MDLEELCKNILTPARGEALAKAFADKRVNRITLYGLAGSAPAMLMGALPAEDGDSPVLVVGDTLDDAGYLYHDLSRVLGEGAVLMFPSGYKRAIKYGQPDPPSQIMRTEVLNRWDTDRSLRYVVTYPEALAEKVASRDTIDTHTLHLATGGTADLAETAKWLRTNGFQEVDYVYDPGHFAVRGSILDIYGYSSEEPFRIDFFGDEIESIRAFNIETQLSERKLDSIAVTSNVAQQSSGSLLTYLKDNSPIWVRDADYTVERIKAIAADSFSDSALIADEGDSEAMKQVIDPEEFATALSRHRLLAFHAPPGQKPSCTSRQPPTIPTERTPLP